MVDAVRSVCAVVLAGDLALARGERAISTAEASRSFGAHRICRTRAIAASAANSNASPRDWILWLALSACGSVLLLATTNHLTEDVAPVPLLWVLPLALYLLTFTMAFAKRSLYSRWLMVRLVALVLAGLGYAIYDPSFTESVQVAVPLFGLGLFVCCLFCHGELARLRPAPERLTSFYLVIAAGGALGAIFVGLIAPLLFAATYEFPLALCFTALAAAAVLWDTTWLARAFWTVGIAALVAVLAYHVHAYERNSILVVRNFYGGLRVQLHYDWLKRPYHTLYHGQIEHGAQFLDPPKSADPITYYARNSGVGIALDFFKQPSRRIGVVGLGTGTIAAYSKRGDAVRFYEINPLIVKIANNQFSYLKNARTNGVDIAIRMGDARLSLANDEAEQFDVLVIDAFSGDAIPVHLLTREAIALYLQHLKPDGVLAIHTSNTYLDLNPLVKLLADDAGIEPRLISSIDDQRKLVDAADWMLLTRNQDFLLHLDESTFQDASSPPEIAALDRRLQQPVPDFAADEIPEKGIGLTTKKVRKNPVSYLAIAHVNSLRAVLGLPTIFCSLSVDALRECLAE